MPIFRYFIFVGGALLALLFVADFVCPTTPVAGAIATASNDQPLIRIRSDRHLPERVVLDTSQPTIIAPPLKTAAVVAPQPVQADALADMSAKARVRETFAQFTPAPRVDAVAGRKPEAKPQAEVLAQAPKTQGHQIQAQPKRKLARSNPAPQPGRPMMLVAQQPHFGLFNTTW
ncbi:hypothetical protein JQ554_07960 [Bradyrhizobium diazoefficiens]|jgi:hypothetical protein|nr:hypothetical protein [Bradyrhizobium diazoefficiens]UCF52397.1 MAG: hypothetical protein JSV48_24715 [Bradyrhizobium sp.]MBR0964268.1 hypothetical protein [Bradyrhizobium diazoefficiens]MBR0978428.1 hypothetical protein [Bradyrhizobium diazoefficiens]MBR1006359.1 hypothetical protein [Bradyrhizobium diazoefficiens]MBR1016735.1 hypothetical protein [Bradyrhizobium diazoefficiens]